MNVVARNEIRETSQKLEKSRATLLALKTKKDSASIVISNIVIQIYEKSCSDIDDATTNDNMLISFKPPLDLITEINLTSKRISREIEKQRQHREYLFSLYKEFYDGCNIEINAAGERSNGNSNNQASFITDD